MKAVAAADTSILYPAGGHDDGLNVANWEIDVANEIVDGIVAGDLPPVRVITNIEQETLDHIKDDTGISLLRDRLEEWRTPRIDFRMPPPQAIQGARELMTTYESVEFADGALISYLNMLETDRVAVYTIEKKMDHIFRNAGIKPVHSPTNPFEP